MSVGLTGSVTERRTGILTWVRPRLGLGLGLDFGPVLGFGLDVSHSVKSRCRSAFFESLAWSRPMYHHLLSLLLTILRISRSRIIQTVRHGRFVLSGSF